MRHAVLARLRSTCPSPRSGPREGHERNAMTACTPQQVARARRFCVAPMMDWTDRHCRFFHRLLTRRALLYTEMITTAAVIFGDRARLLACDEAEHPVALQLGGCDVRDLAACARI